MAVEQGTTPTGVPAIVNDPPQAIEPVVDRAPQAEPNAATPEPTAEATPTRPLTTREKMFARAVENSRREKIKDGVEIEARESGDPDADDDVQLPEGTETVDGVVVGRAGVAVPAAPPAEAQPEVPAAQPTTDPAARKFRLKVNGQDVERDEAEVLRLAQLGEASTQKFQQAAELARQAQEMMQRAQQLGAQQPQPRPTATPAQATAPAGAIPPPPAAITLAPEDLASTIEAIQYGSKEQGAAALGNVISKAVQQAAGRATGATPQELYAQIAPAIANEVLQKVEYDQAVAQFGQEFKSIIADLDLSKLAADRVHAIRWRDAQAGVTNRAHIDVFREAGNMVLQKFPHAVAEQPQPNPQQTGALTFAQKQAAKEALPPTASAATARAVIGQPEQQARTPAQVVADMQKQRLRGQGVQA